MAGQITAIQIQKRNRDRANIFLDGSFAFGLDLMEAAKLSKGQHLSDEDINRLRIADEQARAYAFALDFLSYRPRSSAEVARRLQEKEFCTATIDQVIERLSRARLIDDEEFARYWINNREQFKPRGTRALRHELRQKGVSDQIVDSLLQDIDEEENAFRAASPRIANWKRLDPTTYRRKLTSYLQRRGFNYDVISRVWERMQAEQGTPEADKREDRDIWNQEP